MSNTMTKDELWAAYVARNPQFANDEGNVTLSAAGLRKLFNQTWEYGNEAGYVAGKQAVRDAASSGMPDFFRGMFDPK